MYQEISWDFRRIIQPSNYGHMQMAIEAVNLGQVDEVWIIPCGERTDKQIEATPQQRLEMVNIIAQDMFKNEFPIKVDDIEIRNGENIPTYFLIKQLEAQYPQNDFLFIMGSDLIDQISSWDEGEKLKKEIKFLIFRRSNMFINKDNLPDHYVIINTTFVASSSTEVRKRIRQNYLYISNEKLSESEEELSDLDEILTPTQYTSFSEKSKFLKEVPITKGNVGKFKRKLTPVILDYERKYLGVYGIIPFSLIEYIKEHQLYFSKLDDKSNQKQNVNRGNTNQQEISSNNINQQQKKNTSSI